MQVYLQSAQGDDQSWNAKFSSMMVKVLQDSYVGSPLCKQNLARTDVLIEQAAPKKPPPKVSNPSFASNLLVILVQDQPVVCWSECFCTL